jgi:hypothetical protein
VAPQARANQSKGPGKSSGRSLSIALQPDPFGGDKDGGPEGHALSEAPLTPPRSRTPSPPSHPLPLQPPRAPHKGPTAHDHNYAYAPSAGVVAAGEALRLQLGLPMQDKTPPSRHQAPSYLPIRQPYYYGYPQLLTPPGSNGPVHFSTPNPGSPHQAFAPQFPLTPQTPIAPGQHFTRSPISPQQLDLIARVHGGRVPGIGQVAPASLPACNVLFGAGFQQKPSYSPAGFGSGMLPALGGNMGVLSPPWTPPSPAGIPNATPMSAPTPPPWIRPGWLTWPSNRRSTF